MRVTFAKILCFFTALLLGGNIVFASIPRTNVKTFTSVPAVSKSKELLISKGDFNSTVPNFVLEKDPFEDFQLIADLPEREIEFVLQPVFELTDKTNFYGSHILIGLKLPRWLWVRHILI